MVELHTALYLKGMHNLLNALFNVLHYEKYIEAAGKFKDSISVKLSAIHPKYELRNHTDVVNSLVPKLAGIARLCEENDTTMFIDAEEAARLDLSIMVLEELLSTYNWLCGTSISETCILDD